MTDVELHRATLRALDNARPNTIVQALQNVLAEHLGSRHVQLMLADYQLTRLRPVDDPDNSVTLDGDCAGKAFTTQSPVVSVSDGGEENVYLPVTARGDRLGVLRVTMSDKVDRELLDELTDVATLTGYALSATSGHSDFLHRAARTHRLTLAAELQWQLLPARGCVSSEYELAGLLEPAYSVHADNFDWSEDADNLVVGITDGSPKARHYPLLTTLAVTAIRNARRSGLSIAEQFAMANEAVYAHHRGDPWVGALMVTIDVSTGHVRAIKAGSPQAIVVRRDEIHTMNLTDQMPLGMFEGTEYDEQWLDLAPGDRLLLLSDGVLDAMSSHGEPYRDNRLHSLLGRMHQHSPTAVVRAIIDDLIEHHEDVELDDDATVVCLDWDGPGTSSTLRLSEPTAGSQGAKRRLQVVPEVGSLKNGEQS